MARRMAKGQFDMNDFLTQIRQLQKMGGLGGLMGMLPGIGKMQKQIAAGIDDSMIKRQEAIILSMTKKERVSVGLLNASRRKRIAAGSGYQRSRCQQAGQTISRYGADDEKAGWQNRRRGDESDDGRRPWWYGRRPGQVRRAGMPDLNALSRGLGAGGLGKGLGGLLGGGAPNGLPGLGGKPAGKRSSF